MSTQVVEQAVDFRGMTPDIIETSTGKKIKQASAVRWVWQSFRDIKLFDNLSPAVRNNLTLSEPPVEVLRRCQPYPITNCEYEVSLHERMRYSFTGDELPESDLPDSYAGEVNPVVGNPAPRHVVENKYAYAAAAELSEKYSKEYGLIVLEPLTGEEDSNVVRQIFEMVQPVTYKLATLEKELKDGAKERIKKSTYPKELKALAEKCRLLMLKGFERALMTAKTDHSSFAMQIQMASAGHKGNRAAPQEYDEFIAEQLDVEVPRVVTMVKSRRDDGDFELATLLAEERIRRAELEAKVDKLLTSQKETV